jgi:hypothetical protein
VGADYPMESTMLAKTTIALAAAAVLGVVSAAHAAIRDNKGGFGMTKLIPHSYYEVHGNGRPRNELLLPTALPDPVIRDDFEGYPHPR